MQVNKSGLFCCVTEEELLFKMNLQTAFLDVNSNHICTTGCEFSLLHMSVIIKLKGGYGCVQHEMFMIEWTIRVEHMLTAQSTWRRYVGVVPGFNVARGLSLQLTSHAMVMSQRYNSCFVFFQEHQNSVAPITRRQIIFLFPLRQQRPCFKQAVMVSWVEYRPPTQESHRLIIPTGTYCRSSVAVWLGWGNKDTWLHFGIYIWLNCALSQCLILDTKGLGLSQCLPCVDFVGLLPWITKSHDISKTRLVSWNCGPGAALIKWHQRRYQDMPLHMCQHFRLARHPT